MLLFTNKTLEKLQYDLVRDGLISLEILQKVQTNAQTNSSNIANELISQQIITQTELLKFIEKKLHIPSVELEDYTPDTSCLKYIDYENAKKHNIFPLFKIEDVLTIAMADPLDLFTINNIFELDNLSIEPVVCAETSIQKAISKYYLNKSDKTFFWQEELISDNISDEILIKVISDIITDAIKSNTHTIIMEKNTSSLDIFFNKNLKGYIPNILVKRFIFEFKNFMNLDDEIETITQNSSIIFKYNNLDYSVFTTIFYTKFGFRITININKKFNTLDEYNISQNKLSELFKNKGLIGLELSDEKQAFIYTIANHLSTKHNILLIENKIKCEIPNITQIEFNKNTAIYFDEILNQIEYQNFDIIFWEKFYTQEQLNKLKLLASEKIIVTQLNPDFANAFDFIITKNWKIK